MAKVEKAEKKGNIEDVAGLTKEWSMGRMVPRKLALLKVKLIELNKGEIITKEEKDLLLNILKRDRAQGKLLDKAHELILITEEAKEATDVCFVKADHLVPALHLKKHDVCKFMLDPVTQRYVIFHDRLIPTSHQMTENLIKREERGHFPAPEEYPADKIQLRRLDVSAREFEAWFEVQDESILKPGKQEETYTF